MLELVISSLSANAAKRFGPRVSGNIIMNSGFLSGARLVAPPRFDPGDALQLIEQERVTRFEGVPTMYYQMLCHERIGTTDLSSVARCTVGGQTMPSATIDEVSVRFGCPLIELWGTTEIGGPSITHSPCAFEELAEYTNAQTLVVNVAQSAPKLMSESK